MSRVDILISASAPDCSRAPVNKKKEQEEGGGKREKEKKRSRKTREKRARSSREKERDEAKGYSERLLRFIIRSREGRGERGEKERILAKK